jgi:hypothetical protein
MNNSYFSIFVIYFCLFIYIIVALIGTLVGIKRHSEKLVILSGILGGMAFYALIDIIPDFGTKLSAFSTAAVAVLAAVTINENRKLERRARLDGNLREIMQWAMDVQNIDLAISATNASELYVKDPALRLSLLARGEYIANIANKSFPNELTNEINNVIDNLAAIAYLRFGPTIGNDIAKKVRGRALGSINNLITSQKQNSSITPYTVGLATAINELLFKLSEVKTKSS